MSLTEETTTEPAPPPGEAIADVEPAAQRVLLVWDAPNLDMGLGSILGRRPTALER
ncbi:MAG: NYN domain-containing protein, partial [Mycobacterium sp.]